jgi:hypothetical protein
MQSAALLNTGSRNIRVRHRRRPALDGSITIFIAFRRFAVPAKKTVVLAGLDKNETTGGSEIGHPHGFAQ